MVLAISFETLGVPAFLALGIGTGMVLEWICAEVGGIWAPVADLARSM